MFLPTIFKNKKCNCGTVIEEDAIREIGVSVKDGKFLLRFNCPQCGLAGKLTFPNKSNDVIEFCRTILSENEQKKSVEHIRQSQFYREKLGCLYMPSWTNESFDEFQNQLDKMDFSGQEPE